MASSTRRAAAKACPTLIVKALGAVGPRVLLFRRVWLHLIIFLILSYHDSYHRAVLRGRSIQAEMTFPSVNLEIGALLSPGDKEGPSRVVTPRFSPSPPLRSFLSINPRKSQRTEILSLYVSSIVPFLSSLLSSLLFLLLPVTSNVFPFSFSLPLDPVLPHSVYRRLTARFLRLAV